MSQQMSQLPYRAYITREPFLFFEMRTTARLLCTGIGDAQAAERIIKENLFQYPTEKSLRGMAAACIRRLHNMEDDALIEAIAHKPQDIARQVCLYAFMKQHRLICDFMLAVIGEKYRQHDMSFGRMDMNVFFLRLQEQDDAVAQWSDSTIVKLKQILVRVLVDNEYLDTIRADRLNPVLLSPLLENAMRLHGDEAMFPAFNRFE